jgi:hypothetical protein
VYNEIIDWLTTELLEAEKLQNEFDTQAAAKDYQDYELEISRHEQDGFVSALSFVLRKLGAKSYIFEGLAFIDADGEYSSEADLLVFRPDALTADQWEIIGELARTDRQDCALALLHGDAETVEAFKKDAGL